MSQPEELRNRTKTFALRIVKLFRALPNNTDAQVMGRQLLRSGASVADFVSKIAIVVEEADESVFWLELLGEAGIVKTDRLDQLLCEARELTAVFTASQKTARTK